MFDYFALLSKIQKKGSLRGDRTGTGTKSLFGEQIKFDISKNFPLLVAKQVPFKLVLTELLWFLSGSTNNNDLKLLNGNNKPTIWEEWALECGDLGPIYGKQWVDFNGVNQIENLIDGIIKNPNSRRLIVTALNPEVLPDESISPQDNVIKGKQALGPCHTFFQYYVDGDNLSCHVYMRSCDVFLGLPFNIASYAALTYMIALLTNKKPKTLIMSFGDVHLYQNHLDQAKILLSRNILLSLPRLEFTRRPETIFDFTLADFKLIDYNPLAAIPAPISK